MGFDLHLGDCAEVLKTLPALSVDTCVTSPPYFGLRDYGMGEQIGLESTPEEFVARLVGVFREVRRVLKDDGTLWVNMGDSYARNPSKGTTGTPNGRNVAKQGYSGGAGVPDGIKEKDLIGIPWMLAFALRADGWYLRSDIIWSKPNPMPESVTDRPTKAHEYIFLFAKSARCYYDADAIREPHSSLSDTQKRSNQFNKGEKYEARPDLTGRSRLDYFAEGGRNKRTVWSVAPKPYKGAHFATFPPDLIRPCVLAGSRKGGVVPDPFNGSGTTGQVAMEEGRAYIGIDLNPEYLELTRARFSTVIPTLPGL